jgi:hypothetical protein
MDDYVEAFNLHVNEPVLQPRIFDWLETSLEQLVLLENPEDLVKAVKKLFVTQFTKKKNSDLTSIGDAEQILNSGKTPIGKLKVAVCR